MKGEFPLLDVNNFDRMRIGLASPEMIRQWSSGEVKKPETINYRTLKPEREGLFCEKIFGPTKDWECHCGKYKRVRYKGIICDRCGVEVTRAKVRRERLGHIELAAPVSHIWHFKGIPSRMGLLLDMSPRNLEKVLYFVNYIVIDPGDTPLVTKNLLTENEYREYTEKYSKRFRAGMGAEAIKEILEAVNLDELAVQLRQELKDVAGQRKIRAIRRLEVVEAFRQSGNHPEWMILDVVPVIPPELRPMVQLDGGRFATSDLNDLYRRVINRNNRLKRLLDLNAPDIIVRNEKRMLQEAVDALIDNGRRGRPVTGPGNRPLKSISDLLKGKQGRFRQNLLGKRVDYSGRSVIVVGPDLKLHQCGLPKEMALELFKPFVMKRLVKDGIAHNIKNAKRMVERVRDEVWDVLEDVISEHPVMLNRAPTLHRLGIQAFEPVLVEGRAIKIHPMVCTAYNADFDGDQMAVHVPLSTEAQTEARLLMLASQNILSTKDGRPIATPTQDMVLGIYYLTQELVTPIENVRFFSTVDEAVVAYEYGEIKINERMIIGVIENGVRNRYLSSLGRMIFNGLVGEELGFKELLIGPPIERGLNVEQLFAKFDRRLALDKKTMGKIVGEAYRLNGAPGAAKIIDKMKEAGFKYATKGGVTIGICDIVIPERKKDILREADAEVELVKSHFNRGLMTDDERYQKVTDRWTKATEELTEELMSTLQEDNPVYMMATSGARGNKQQIRQLAGMRGLMADPSGRIIDLPIRANFREGLTVLEYFISTHGARKGLADTALRTADSGYLTRRLVDVSQDVIVREDDCGTTDGAFVSDIREGRQLIKPLFDRIVGRISLRDVVHPKTGEVIVPADTFIDETLAQKIILAEIPQVEIRSVIACKSKHGVCVKCYGRNLATSRLVDVGEAVGIIAAQSIGEPGTQLTMRTFHTGGVAGDDITAGLPRVEELFEARKPKGKGILAEASGEIEIVDMDDKKDITIITEDGERRTISVHYGARLKVGNGDAVVAGTPLTEGSLDPHEILKYSGVRAVQSYILREVQSVYNQQGVDIDDKHIEVIVRQMLRKIKIEEAGDTALLPGSMSDMFVFADINQAIVSEGGEPAIGEPILLGVSKSALATDSFLSAASFQETTRVLTEASIKGKVDQLIGLKENVIIGKLIPAGTGMAKYRKTEVDVTE
jgi:DNA-directed RNA polymerase subunit beta'